MSFSANQELEPLSINLLQQDIAEIRNLLVDAVTQYGSFTHPIVIQLSQSLDLKILQVQSNRFLNSKHPVNNNKSRKLSLN